MGPIIRETTTTKLLGFLKSQTDDDSDWGKWRDIKVAGNFACMGSELENHGMQIFDMKRLLNVQCDNNGNSAKYCKQFSPDAVYTGVSWSHNIVASADPNYV